jgi:hypothetical protein
VKLDGLLPSSFNINDFAGRLGLKDGQKIIGRIVRTGSGEVLLQLAGKTVAAKLEGEPVPLGSLILLGVSLSRGDRIELKVMENLSQSAAERADAGWPDSAGVSQIRALIAVALKESGLNDSAPNIEKVANLLKAFESRYQQLPAPRVFTFLLGKNWPVTPGTLLLSWLYHDRELRETLWNFMDRSPWVRHNPALLPKILDLGTELSDWAEPGVDPDEPIMPPNATQGREPQTPDKTRYRPAEIGKLKAVLEQSLRLEKAGNGRNRLDGAEAPVPFLVRTPEKKLREYIVKWQEKSRETGRGAPEEVVRLVIPTENMGNITLQMLLSSKKTRIGLKVMSDPVQNYITRHLSDLRKAVGPEAQIAVSIAATQSDTESRMDVWM